MLFQRRLLVTQVGPEIDSHLIRCASMLSRLSAAATATRRVSSAASTEARLALTAKHRSTSLRCTSPSMAIPAGTRDAVVRFLTLLPHWGNTAADSATTDARLALWSQVDQHFRASNEQTIVECDAVAGRSTRRILAYAKDFGGDAMLVARACWSASSLMRIAAASPCATWFVPPNWAPVLHRILVPIDFSLRSVASLRAAVCLARRFRPAKCIVLHIDRQDSRYGADEIAPTRRRELRATLDELVASVDPDVVPIAARLVKGESIAKGIARAADEHAVDLVVTSTRGRSWLSGGLLPSVAAATLREYQGALLTLKTARAGLNWRAAIRERWEQSEGPHFS